jgi:hypothetical protein
MRICPQIKLTRRLRLDDLAGLSHRQNHQPMVIRLIQGRVTAHPHPPIIIPIMPLFFTHGIFMKFS